MTRITTSWAKVIRLRSTTRAGNIPFGKATCFRKLSAEMKQRQPSLMVVANMAQTVSPTARWGR